MLLDQFLDEVGEFDSNDAEETALRTALRAAYDLLTDEARDEMQAQFPTILKESRDVRH